jgi:hypothetical protein
MAHIPPIDEIFRLRKGPSEGTYVSVAHPVRMGNAAPIAYGGCALGIAVQAAFFSITETPKKALYSFTCARGCHLG